MNFSTATTLNAKANAAVDNLYERGLLPVPSEGSATSSTVRTASTTFAPTRSPSWPAGH
ncbi:hypothetical protein [Streptomyces sp. C8S0]|uniref:hypothetical protein n=1 Tax=Streptomyces sp. C8S0 TaxID=2585716 RepID=UPI0018695767|nr:hypothetical protein [Streptomyces sp. C8S0]